MYTLQHQYNNTRYVNFGIKISILCTINFNVENDTAVSINFEID